MSNSTLNLNNPISSPCPTYVWSYDQIVVSPTELFFFAVSSNGRQAVGDGAFYVDAAPSVLAICQVQGEEEMYYYSTTFSGGGPGVCTSIFVILSSGVT